MEGSHGVQRHVGFVEEQVDTEGVFIQEELEWLDARAEVMAEELRSYTFRKLEESDICGPSRPASGRWGHR